MFYNYGLIEELPASGGGGSTTSLSGKGTSNSAAANAQPSGKVPLFGKARSRATASALVGKLMGGVARAAARATALTRGKVLLQAKSQVQVSTRAQNPVANISQPLSATARAQLARLSLPPHIALSASSTVTVTTRSNSNSLIALTGVAQAQAARRTPPSTSVLLQALSSAQVTARPITSGIFKLTGVAVANAASSAANPSLAATLGLPPQTGMSQGFLFHPGAGPTWELRRRQAFPPGIAPTSLPIAGGRAGGQITSSSALSVAIVVALRSILGMQAKSGAASPSFGAAMQGRSLQAVRSVAPTHANTALLSGSVLSALSMNSAFTGPGFGRLQQIAAACIMRFTLSGAMGLSGNRVGTTMYVMEEIRTMELPSRQ